MPATTSTGCHSFRMRDAGCVIGWTTRCSGSTARGAQRWSRRPHMRRVGMASCSNRPSVKSSRSAELYRWTLSDSGGDRYHPGDGGGVTRDDHNHTAELIRCVDDVPGRRLRGARLSGVVHGSDPSVAIRNTTTLDNGSGPERHGWPRRQYSMPNPHDPMRQIPPPRCCEPKTFHDSDA